VTEKGTLVGYLEKVPGVRSFVEPVFEFAPDEFGFQSIDNYGRVSTIVNLSDLKRIIWRRTDIQFEFFGTEKMPVFGYRWDESDLCFGRRFALADALMLRYSELDDFPYKQAQALEFAMRRPRAELDFVDLADAPLTTRLFEDYTAHLSSADRALVRSGKKHIPSNDLGQRERCKEWLLALRCAVEYFRDDLIIIAVGIAGNSVLTALEQAEPWLKNASVLRYIEGGYIDFKNLTMASKLPLIVTLVGVESYLTFSASPLGGMVSFRRPLPPVVPFFSIAATRLSPCSERSQLQTDTWWDRIVENLKRDVSLSVLSASYTRIRYCRKVFEMWRYNPKISKSAGLKAEKIGRTVKSEVESNIKKNRH
jgi:hypothetical protein